MNIKTSSLVLLTLASTVLARPAPVLALSDNIYRELETFTRVIEIVDKQYVEPVDDHKLIEGAIQGMLGSLDPHSVYFSPEMYKDFQSDTTGKFGGIGIEINQKDGIITVVSPIEDSPAFKAGIKSGDRIIKINGELTKGMSLADAVHKMRGPRGKKVTISVWREGLAQPQDFTMEREIIRVQAVKNEVFGDGYGYVRITSFQEKTGEDVKKALKELDGATGGLKGLILDLRDNPGGLLSEAVNVSDLFMDGGPIVSTRSRNQETEISTAKKNSPFEKTPIVVLVNHGSASASEIVAGALQDSKRAKILGLTSFGKGSVQTVVELANKAALKITIARYYTPKGRSIEGRGIEPDVSLGTKQLNTKFPKKEGVPRPDLYEFQKTEAMEYLQKQNPKQ